jgi:hypothetical protein
MTYCVCHREYGIWPVFGLQILMYQLAGIINKVIIFQNKFVSAFYIVFNQSIKKSLISEISNMKILPSSQISNFLISFLDQLFCCQTRA